MPVHAAMANHPTIQCGSDKKGEFVTLRPLGLINGLFGVQHDGWGHIASVYEIDHNYEPVKLLRFERLVRPSPTT